MRRTIGSAFPRLGLLGNPSDGYGGRVLAVTFEDFRAEVELEDGVQGAEEPLLAAVRKLFLAARAPDGAPPFALRFTSDIPRQVGLAGSSAIAIAALRALARRFEARLEPAEIAELALRAETEELGNAAGPQDRVVQSFGGLVDMDFAQERYERLDPALLPPLFVAWTHEPGERSGVVHDGVRARFERGDREVIRVMRELPRLVERGVGCLHSGDRQGFMQCMDANFDLRASIWRLSDADRQLVSIGRDAGAAVKFAGSGGAVVGALAGEDGRERVEAAYRRAGFPILRPRLGKEEA